MIDFTFIEKLEGYRLEGYVPDAENSKSGMTIASGFDLGQRDAAEIKQAFPPSLAERLMSYVGFKGVAAQRFLDSHPLKISEQEATLINQYAHGSAIKQLEDKWRTDCHYFPIQNFNDLGCILQTVVASVAFQYGDLESRTPNYWQQVTTGDWPAALANLRNFGDRYPTRRNKEADLLESWLNV